MCKILKQKQWKMKVTRKLRSNSLYFVSLLTIYIVVTQWSSLTSKRLFNPQSMPFLRRERNDEEIASESSTKDKDWAELLQCQAYRQGRLKEQCAALGLTRNLTLLSESELQAIAVRFMVDERHQLILKSIPKTGCSSWKHIIMANHPDGEKYRDIWEHDWVQLRRKMGLTTLDRLKKDEIVYKLQNYFTILTVRHPLMRLESFFKNKIIDENGLANRAPEGRDEFFKKKIGEHFQKELNWMMSVPIKDLNQHFAPYTTKLAMECIIPYRFISKTETAEPEMEYVIEKHLSGKGDPYKDNTSTNVTKVTLPPRSDGGFLLPVFSKLPDPAKTIHDLEKMIGEDMKVFGYGFKLEDDQVIATCDSYSEFGYCC